jgi:protoporphyrinogen oxidase
MRRDQVVIIGAGPAGLTAAHELTKQGFRPTVLEGSDQVGGLSRTVNYKGYRFDIGGHRFFSKVPVINELWHEILGGEFLLRPRMSRIYYDRHFFDYPLKALNALSGLGPVEALRVCWSYLESKVSPINP